MFSATRSLLVRGTVGDSVRRSAAEPLRFSDFLYGDVNSKSLPGTFDDLDQYRTLLTWKADQWVNLLKKYVHRLFTLDIQFPNAFEAVFV
jgi:hypothetical protein